MFKKLKSFIKKSAVVVLLILTFFTTLQNSSIIKGSSASVYSQDIPDLGDVNHNS